MTVRPSRNCLPVSVCLSVCLPAVPAQTVNPKAKIFLKKGGRESICEQDQLQSWLGPARLVEQNNNASHDTLPS